MKTWSTTTPANCEGHNISYGDEKRCADALLAMLPDGWTVATSWCQILFSDVQYEINFDEKVVHIEYCQSLSYWFPELGKEVIEKVGANEKAPKQ